jgi:peptidoglycan/LPS O-acetylase OafA/YrhL
VGPLWSISIEEQFYLVWPWVMRWANRRTLALICFLGWIASQTTLLYFCFHHTLNSPAVWTNSLVQLQYFALGVGLSLYFNGSVPSIRGGLRLLTVLGAFLLFPAAECLFDKDGIHGLDQYSSIAHTYPIYLFGGISVLAILIGFLGCGSLESWRILRYLGKISYGLYVYHSLAIGLAAHVVESFGVNSQFVIVLGLLADIGIAWISYEYIERPFMRMKERFAIVRSREA